MLLLNVATTLKAPLLGLFAAFAAASPAPAGGIEAPGAAIAAEMLYWDEDYPRGGGLDGTSEDFDAGQDCGGMQRTRYEASLVAGKGNCSVVNWVTDDPKDCRVRVHIDVAAFGWAICRVQVYVAQ